MRKALLMFCVLFAVSSFAQQPQSSAKKFRLSVFATDLSYTVSENAGSHLGGGLGAALEYRWNEKWALELQVASEEHTRTFSRIDQNGNFSFDRQEQRSYPVDLIAHYDFVNSSRWKPFIGAGFRYERSPFAEFGSRTAFEIDGGVHFMISPSLSLRMDAKQLLFDDRGDFSAGLKPSIGLGWKF